MNPTTDITIGTCTHGPVILSDSTQAELKFSVVVIHYDAGRHVNLIASKTTSQALHQVWPDEIYLDDLFGRGPSKIQVPNIIRTRKEKIPEHRHIGILDSSLMPQFEQGLKIAIASGRFSSDEALDLADSWQQLFSLT